MEVKLENVRLSFPALFEAKGFPGTDKKAYSSAFLMEKDSAMAKAISAAQKTVADEKWGGKAPAVLKSLPADKLVLKDGNSKTEYAGYENMVFINASNAIRPTVIDRDKTPLTASDGKPYGGCYVNAIVDVWAQDNQYGKRVNATLKGVQFFKDGDAFGASGIASADAFEDIEEGADTSDLL